MGLLLQILLEFVLQAVGELVVEVLWGLGDFATGGRMRRVAVFAVSGLALGGLSAFALPSHLVASPPARYATVAGLTVAGGLLLAIALPRGDRAGDRIRRPQVLAAFVFGGLLFVTGHGALNIKIIIEMWYKCPLYRIKIIDYTNTLFVAIIFP